MSTLPEVLETVTLGPDDRLVVFWPPYITHAQLEEAQKSLKSRGLDDRVVHIAGAEEVAVLRATKAAGSTVGPCGDVLYHVFGPNLTCHLAADHTGAHSDGEATWSAVADLGEVLVSTDLRQKLAVLFACRCDLAWTERDLHAPNCIEELQDDVVDIVADWLRAAALEWRDQAEDSGGKSMRQEVRCLENAYLIEALADSITTPKGEHG